MKANIKVVMVVAVAFSCAGISAAQEKRIQRKDLPPAVEKAVAAESAGATIRGFTYEKDHGQDFYEAEMLVKGLSKDVLMDKEGKVLEVEEQVPLDKLPPDVKAGLHAKAGNGRILKVESLTKRGQLKAYEAQILKRGKRFEIQVGPDGKPLAHEE